MKYLFVVSLTTMLTACNQCTYPIDVCAPSSEETTLQEKVRAAQEMIDQEAQKCNVEYKNKKITFYAANQCQLDAIEKYESPLYPDQQAFRDYRTERLFLALQVEQKKISKKEANLKMKNLLDKMRARQNALFLAAAEQRKQNQIATGRAILGTLNQGITDYQSKADPQMQQNTIRSINCTTFDNWTNCQY